MGAFFINRPIFAWVISIVIMLGGLGAIYNLPVAQYPDIAPPTVRISTTYTGASCTFAVSTTKAPASGRSWRRTRTER